MSWVNTLRFLSEMITICQKYCLDVRAARSLGDALNTVDPSYMDDKECKFHKRSCLRSKHDLLRCWICKNWACKDFVVCRTDCSVQDLRCIECFTAAEEPKAVLSKEDSGGR